MRRPWLPFCRRFRQVEQGAVAVEFGLIFPLLLLLVLGGMDFGHMFFMQHIITNASREGARFAAKYTGNTSIPSSTAVATYVKTTLNYDSLLSGLTVTASTTGTSPNRVVTVTVQAQKNWWILHILPGFSSGKVLQATTAMVVEGP
jgi:Flp pilus assembly protein TadG